MNSYENWQDFYPRPMLKRQSFFNLNGEWFLDNTSIDIPFPPQSTLSHYNKEVNDHLTYIKEFQLPQDFVPENHRILLHFGAIDQIARVYINNQYLGEHIGGYLPFSFDITDFLKDAVNQLRVDVTDTLSHVYPYGKQRKKRGGMWYTPVSGIWQTVWIEAVPQQAIQSIKITPSLSGIHIHIDSDATQYHISIPLNDYIFEKTYSSQDIDIDLSKETDTLHLWTPKNPYLYSITIKTETDCIESYFALRTIEIKNQQICLNNQPIFLHGVLDQGYFDDGIFLPEKPQGFVDDILKMKELGFNFLRKHIKIEPEVFYYACDKYGMLIMQDMVNNGNYNWFLDTALPNKGVLYRPDRFPGQKQRKQVFEKHMLETLDHLYNHPCIISYTIFNEGWGQFDADRMYKICKSYDPTRFYDATSGWFHQKESDVDSLHVYFCTKELSTKMEKPLFLSECGGYTRPIQDHLFKKDAHYGYGQTDSEEALTNRIIDLYEEMVLSSIPNGLCGCVYTQLSDVEDEINGLYTYDRQVCKVDKKRMQDISNKIFDCFKKNQKKRL